MKYFAEFETEIGKILIGEESGALTDLFPVQGEPPAVECTEPTVLLQHAAQQVREYLAGERTTFSLPTAPAGTEFQRAVWQALREIPYGETRSYRELAQAIGRPGAARAVGQAAHRNPLLLLVPCHRLVGANGSLTGFAAGLAVKKRLLLLEQSAITGARSKQERGTRLA